MASVSIMRLTRFRSTPPRGRRPGRVRARRVRHQVSIHASAREATRFSPSFSSSDAVSIHASAREATCGSAWPRHPLSCFDPRLRAGGDKVVLDCPAKYWLFRSTPPRGRRLDATLPKFRDKWFRSTPPRGRRPRRRAHCWRSRRFDPRLRAGGDPDTPVRNPSTLLFRSTPPRGRRPMQASPRSEAPLFRSTPPRGRRRGPRRGRRSASGFDPRLRAGGDVPVPQWTASAPCFDPRLRAGGDRSRAVNRSR